MSENAHTYDLGLLEQSLAKWRRSAALRAVYQDIFREMAAECAPGRSLELGSGIGVARGVIPGLVTSDVAATPFVDRVVSAYDIPVENWGNLLAMDMLHHLQRPFDFFASAARALAPGGRVVLAEPAATWGGCRFYGAFHHEPCLPARIVPPFDFPPDADGGFANMGMGQALFATHRNAVVLKLARFGLSVRSVRYRDLLAYPATGGFSRGSLLPAPILRGLLALEHLLPQVVLRRVGLRMIIVLEMAPGN